MQQTTFNIELPVFNGPFDLLLFFIERDELDIYNIPIAKISQDFLDYMHQMEMMNIDLAGEFILVAATLMRVKAKMLLPRKAVDASGNEIDPREELVQKLLEYKSFKGVLDDFRKYEEERLQKELRGNTATELKILAEKALVDAELESLTLFKLLRSFTSVMDRYENKNKQSVHTVVNYPYTISGQREYIFSKIADHKKASFNDLFASCENRIHAIITFLALLELLNQNTISFVGGDGVNQFWIQPIQSPDLN